MPKRAAPALLVAANSFVLELGGRRIAFKKGDPIEAEHPAVKKHPDLFEPIMLRYPIEDRIEQATAAPGEKRNIGARLRAATRPKAKAKAKAKAKPEPKPEPESVPPQKTGTAVTTSAVLPDDGGK